MKQTYIKFEDNFPELRDITKTSIRTFKITGEPHEVTEEVDGEMQTFKCFPVEEISNKN